MSDYKQPNLRPGQKPGEWDLSNLSNSFARLRLARYDPSLYHVIFDGNPTNQLISSSVPELTSEEKGGIFMSYTGVAINLHHPFEISNEQDCPNTKLILDGPLSSIENIAQTFNPNAKINKIIYFSFLVSKQSLFA